MHGIQIHKVCLRTIILTAFIRSKQESQPFRILQCVSNTYLHIVQENQGSPWAQSHISELLLWPHSGKPGTRSEVFETRTQNFCCVSFSRATIYTLKKWQLLSCRQASPSRCICGQFPLHTAWLLSRSFSLKQS